MRRSRVKKRVFPPKGIVFCGRFGGKGLCKGFPVDKVLNVVAYGDRHIAKFHHSFGVESRNLVGQGINEGRLAIQSSGTN